MILLIHYNDLFLENIFSSYLIAMKQIKSSISKYSLEKEIVSRKEWDFVFQKWAFSQTNDFPLGFFVDKNRAEHTGDMIILSRETGEKYLQHK